MIWTNGRFSWIAIFVSAYATAVIIATDYAWRVITAPIALIAGFGIAALLIGAAAIVLIGARFKPR